MTGAQADITRQPYSLWLEDTLRELVALEPVSIGIVTIMRDGSAGTQYFHVDNRDRMVMLEAIQIDYLNDLIVKNADYLRDLLDDEDEEGEE